jgi:hypothetical protein
LSAWIRWDRVLEASKHRSATTIRVVLPLDLADLVPQFLVNRRNEAKALLVALVEGDFESIDWIAQRMVGGGAMFGFDQITAIGRMVRCATASRNIRQIRLAIDEYAEYLERLRVEYHGSPDAPIRLAPERARGVQTRKAPRRHPAPIRNAELAREA